MDVFYVSSSFHSVSSCTLCFAEALEVHDFALAKEFDRFAYIGIIHQAQNIVVGGSGFLLGGEVLGRLCILDYKINYSFPFEL